MQIPIKTHARTQMVDITSQVKKAVQDSGIQEGIVLVSSLDNHRGCGQFKGKNGRIRAVGKQDHCFKAPIQTKDPFPFGERDNFQNHYWGGKLQGPGPIISKGSKASFWGRLFQEDLDSPSWEKTGAPLGYLGPTLGARKFPSFGRSFGTGPQGKPGKGFPCVPGDSLGGGFPLGIYWVGAGTFPQGLLGVGPLRFIIPFSPRGFFFGPGQPGVNFWDATGHTPSFGKGKFKSLSPSLFWVVWVAPRDLVSPGKISQVVGRRVNLPCFPIGLPFVGKTGLGPHNFLQ